MSGTPSRHPNTEIVIETGRCSTYRRRNAVQRNPITSIQGAAEIGELRAILANRVARPLADRARRIGRNAGLQAASMVALTPHASWDGWVIGLRGLGAIREIAELFGLRPGPALPCAGCCCATFPARH